MKEHQGIRINSLEEANKILKKTPDELDEIFTITLTIKDFRELIK